jgi:cytidylate kinase
VTFILAIDGPAGAGKSTIARRTAAHLGWMLVDTGAIYRTVALAAKERGLAAEDPIAQAIPGLAIHFADARVILDGRDVTEAIRTPEISVHSSVVSAMPAVRRALLGLQRQIALSHPAGAVLEGRDIGTVVFPDADVKIFLTASPEERARRRTAQLAAKGVAMEYPEVLKEIVDRDTRDATRAVAPLKPAPDAVHVDTTGRPIGEIVEEIVTLVRTR